MSRVFSRGVFVRWGFCPRGFCPGPGRAAKLTKCNKRFIIGKFLKNPRLSAVKVTSEINENFLLEFCLKLIDDFSEQLLY